MPPATGRKCCKKNVASFYANPEEREAHSQRVAEVGFSKEYPVDLRKKDGTIIHALVTTVARKDPQGNIIGFQGTVRDITERKRTEENLRDSEARLLDLYKMLQTHISPWVLMGSSESVIKVPRNCLVIPEKCWKANGFLTSIWMVRKVKRRRERSFRSSSLGNR